MITANLRPTLVEVVTQMGETGARICELDASEAGAGNISVYLGWEIELRRHFPNIEQIQLPVPVPALAGGTVLATGSGRRLRQIPRDPFAAIGAVRIHADGLTGTLYTSPARQFTRLTSEFNSHLAVHHDQVDRRGIDYQALVHAQPPHLTYLSHIPAYQDTYRMSRAVLRWEPESVVALPKGISVLPFLVPGSEQMGDANVKGLRDSEIVLWSKHGTMSRSDVSVFRALDHVEYAETGARYEYMNLLAGSRAEGLSTQELNDVATAFGADARWLEPTA